MSLAKEALDHRPEPRLNRRTNRLLAAIVNQQMIKILTLEFSASIDHQRLFLVN
jgi:hypothetical protein